MASSITKSTDTVLKSLTRVDRLSIHINGSCMAPLINDGDRIQISRQRLYLPGDILVKRDGTDRLIAHRLIGCYPRRSGLHYVTRADNATVNDAAVAGSQIIGKLTGGDCGKEAFIIPLKFRLKSLGQFTQLIINRIQLKIRN